MAWVKVHCPWCNSDDVVFNGKSASGKQKCRCKNPDCPHKVFQLDYEQKAYVPGMKQKIVDMVMNGSGTRDTARVLGVSKDTVTKTLRSLKNQVTPVNEKYIKNLGSEIEIDIMLSGTPEEQEEEQEEQEEKNHANSDEIPAMEAEADEMWSYYYSKENQDWLWWAVDHKTNVPLAFTFGTREYCNLDVLLEELKPFKIHIFYTDGNFAYNNRIPAENLTIGKKNTQHIERDHLTLRTRIKRLARKTICFSKDKQIHETVIGAFINMHFFGRAIVAA